MPEQQVRWRCSAAIVDDEATLVSLFEKLLTQHGIFVCFTANDGNEAVKKYREYSPKPDVILMDYRLPLANGIEATKEILKMGGKTKIIFLSADASVMDEALKAGAVKFLQKPASMKDVLGAIRTVTGVKAGAESMMASGGHENV